MQNGYIIGIDAGGTKIAYGLFDSNGELLDRFQQPTDITADLIVRVAGYSAFFNVLSRQTQDDIIARTEQVL